MNGKASLPASVVLLAIMGWASASRAQEYSYESGYIRQLDGSVSVQRAQNPEPEPGEVNLPVLAGDRVWTGADAFAEVRFVDGGLVRLEASTKVDFMAFGTEPNIRLWNGSVSVDVDDDSARIRIDTPGGSVFPQEAGTYRVDVVDGVTTTVSVARGVVELASESGSVLVASGRSASLEPGARPSEPRAFDTTPSDALASWRQARERREPELRTVPLVDLPKEVHTYVDDLDDYGTWRTDAAYGAVWYPTVVGAGWAPYRNGRWIYTSYGYTWVAHEPWGWAPHHYGRWGYNDYGWYWVPGRHWSPAWVSVAVGPSWVGWSPLGYYGGPVFSYGHSFYGGGRYPHYERRHPYHYGRHGKAVPRDVYDHGAGWNYARKDRFGRRGKARLRASDVRASASSARVQNQGAVFDKRLEPHALGRTNALARRGPQVARFASRGGVRRNAGATRGRAVPRSGTSDRGLQRSLTAFGPSGRAAASRRATTRSRSRVVTPGASTTGRVRARSRERMDAPRRRPPTPTAPVRTRARTQSRTFGTRPAEPRTRGQEFFENSQRRRAVTRSGQKSQGRQGRTTPGRANGGRDRPRSQGLTRTPPRSSRSVSTPPRTRSGRAGVRRAMPRGGGRGASGVRGSGSRGMGRGATGMRGHGGRGARSGASRGGRGGGSRGGGSRGGNGRGGRR